MFDTTFYVLLAIAMLIVVIVMSSVPLKTGKATDRLLPRMACEIIFVFAFLKLQLDESGLFWAAIFIGPWFVGDMLRLCNRSRAYLRLSRRG